MKVLVCGGRDFNSIEAALALTKYFENKEKPNEIIEGGARGADMGAVYFGNRAGIPVRTFKAEWDRYGKSAGFRRNQRMLEEGMPDAVIAFPGGKGTQMMVDLATKANIPVIMPLGFN